MHCSLPSILSAAAALLLLCTSCKSPGTPELWDSLLEPGISRQERTRREKRLVRRLEQEKRQSRSSSGTEAGGAPRQP